MSEMIDRVARAIFASWRKQMDEDGQTGKGPLSFDDLDGDERGFGINAARCAIAAMQEPTKAMEEAGEALDDWGVPSDPGSGNACALAHWEAMIIEALK